MSTNRETVGTEAYAATNRSAQTTTVPTPKQNRQSSDPSFFPYAHHDNILAERLGPRFAIRARWEAPIDPVAAPTQSNGRILPAANPYGSNAEFWDGTLLGKDF